MRLNEKFNNVFSYAAGVQTWVNNCTGVDGGYKYSFAHDFAIADWVGGIKAIRETWKRVFKEWKYDYKVVAEAVSQIAMMSCVHWRLKQDGVENRDVFIQAYQELYNAATGDFNKEYAENEEALDYLFYLTD